MLFNHGVTPPELYVNTPERVTTRKCRWLRDRWGGTNREDSLSKPFKYCLGLIINKVLDDKVRFKIPYAKDSYIDFEIVTDEKFKEHRKNGRFKDIDIVESDFTGYFLRYFYSAKSYQKSVPLYLGGELKKKFLNKINSGENFYTIKDVELKDFYNAVSEKFPEVTKKEIQGLLLLGFRRLHTAIRFGCAATLNTVKYGNCYVFIGEITVKDKLKQLIEYKKRRDKKLRMKEVWKRSSFDGYYYIVLTGEGFKQWIEMNKTTRTVIKFNNVVQKRILEECFYKFPQGHVFRVKAKKFSGWEYWVESLESRDTTYMGEVNNMKFTPSTKTWKNLIKENV